MANPFATPAATPTAAPATPTAAPAAPTAAPVEATEGTATRKKPAKQLTSEQIREVTIRATVNKETPQQIADAMGLVRNQTYRVISEMKKAIAARLEDPATTPENRAKLTAKLAEIPTRSFGEGGAGRTSRLNATLDDLLDSL